MTTSHILCIIAGMTLGSMVTVFALSILAMAKLGDNNPEQLPPRQFQD